MPFVKTIAEEEQKERFAEIMADPRKMGLTNAMICKMFSISAPTIYKKLNDPEIKELIKERRSQRIRYKLPEVDDAMIAKAVRGDVRAAELIYERWDEFVRRSGLEVSTMPKMTKEEVDLRKEKLKLWVEQFKKGSIPAETVLNAPIEQNMTNSSEGMSTNEG